MFDPFEGPFKVAFLAPANSSSQALEESAVSLSVGNGSCGNGTLQAEEWFQLHEETSRWNRFVLWVFDGLEGRREGEL